MFRIRPCIALCALVLSTLSCGGGGSPAEPVPGNVTTEGARAKSLTVGLSGGTMTTTASDGTKYTLVIPEGALAIPTKITMTPVTAIAGFPVLDHLVAGLDFKPSGLAFAVPLTLTIETSKTPGAGELPIAVDYEGDAASFTLGVAAASGGDIVVPVRHFSGFGLAFGTEEDMGAILDALPLTPSVYACMSDLLLLTLPDDQSLAIAIMRGCIENEILPEIQNAANDGELVVALSDFRNWRHDTPFALGVTGVEAELATEIDQALAAFEPLIQAAFVANNDLCKQTHSLDALRNTVFWQKQAELLGIATPANGLDAASASAVLCASVIMDGASLPSDMQVGFPHSLDFRLILKFSDGTQLAVPCAVDITAINADVQNPIGNTDAFGNYTTVITATAGGPVTVFITGNVILPGETTPSIITGGFEVNGSGGGDVSGDYMGILSMTLNGSSFQEVIHTAHVTQTQNGISGTFESHLTSGSFSGTLSNGTVFNPSITINGSVITPTAGSVTQASDGNTGISFSVSGAFTYNTGPAVLIGFNITGPDCKFENLNESGPLNGSSSIRVTRSGNSNFEIQPLTGSLTLSPGSTVASFSGGGFSGTFTGNALKPGLDNPCSVGAVTGTLEVCGLTIGPSTFCLFNTPAGIEIFIHFGSPRRCPSGDSFNDIRLGLSAPGYPGLYCK